MTNATIIFNESLKLMENGVIKGTGEFITIEKEDGTTAEMELPEEIHTFAAWKSLGFNVKKGEHAVAKFPIWKHTSKKVEDENGEEEEKTNMFMKVSAFFSAAQVEKIENGVA